MAASPQGDGPDAWKIAPPAPHDFAAIAPMTAVLRQSCRAPIRRNRCRDAGRRLAQSADHHNELFGTA